MIHKRNPLSVNARGITNNNRTSADVDSNSSSTIPIAYKTLKRKISPVSIKAKNLRTAKYEMGDRKSLTLEHCTPK